MKQILTVILWLAAATALPAMAQVSHTVQFAADSLTGSEVTAGGSEYEIETKGQVLLAPGFKVEKGAYFFVTCSDY